MLDIALADILGSVGVAFLLGAFGLNLFGAVSQKQILYMLMNCVGAGLATLASWLIEYFPFVILEGTWCLVSLVALAASILKLKTN